MKNKGLNQNCTDNYGKWEKYLQLFAENTGAVALRVPFSTQGTKFGNNMITIRLVADLANADLGGITDAKKVAKNDAAMGFSVITRNCLSFALAKNLPTLKQQMKNGTKSKLFKTKDENFVSSCNNLKELLTGVLADYPIEAIAYFTAEEVAGAVLLGEDFSSKLGVWSVADADVRTAKREFENEWIPKMNSVLEIMEGLLAGTITTTYPEFANSFMRLKKIVHTGVRDQGMRPIVVDSETGKPIILKCVAEVMNYPYSVKPKIMKTDSNGLFKLFRLRVGIWTIRFSAPDYVERFMVIKVDRRKVEKPEVKLVKL